MAPLLGPLDCKDASRCRSCWNLMPDGACRLEVLLQGLDIPPEPVFGGVSTPLARQSALAVA